MSKDKKETISAKSTTVQNQGAQVPQKKWQGTLK